MNRPYDLNIGLKSRSISFENQTGERSAGGTKASNLGIGRKGKPSKQIQSGETIQLCNITGPGTIRHIWLTTRSDPEMLRNIVLRAYWENQIHPSIECPIGDFMGYAHGKVMPYHSAVHSIGEKAGMNFWLPMPFTKCGQITFTNEGSTAVPLYHQIDYTLGDNHPFDVGRLHCLFRRENPTQLKKDFELLPKRVGKGRFIGSIIGIRSLNTDYWWGEGEFKVYLDGDTDFPTICGTGSEDYVGLSWRMQQTPFFYHGCSLDQNGFIPCIDGIYWIPFIGTKTVVSQFNRLDGMKVVFLKEKMIGHVRASGMNLYLVRLSRKCLVAMPELLTSGKNNRISSLNSDL